MSESPETANRPTRPQPRRNLPMIVSGLMLALVGPTVSATFMACLCWLTGLQHWSPLFLIPLLPVLYLAWLVVLLLFYAAETSLLALFFKRPRRFHEQEQGIANRHFLIALGLYLRAIMLSSLPLMPLMIGLPGFRRLVLRAYSTRIHIGKNATIPGLISDPDITYIGDNVVIGVQAKLTAHSLTRSVDGFLVYQTAPIELGNGCTIGGISLIEMGVKVGERSLVEHGSRVEHFTVIPPDEVWGGNPAVFKRKREVSFASTEKAPSSLAPAKENRPGEITELITRALSLPAGSVTAETSSQNCLAWDSLGKMFIGAALHDRYGVNLPADVIFALDTVADVERAIGSATNQIPTVASEGFALPNNPELLPLLDSAKVTTALARDASPTEGALSNLRVVVASSFICQPLASTAKLYSAAFGLNTTIEFFDFNQVAQALLSPESSLRQNRDGLNVVLVRPEDLAASGTDGAAKQVDQLLSAIRAFATDGRTVLVSDLPPELSPSDAERRRALEKLREKWRTTLESLPGVQVLDFTGIIEEIGTAAAGDAQMETAASAPYSAAVYQRLGMAVARAARRSRTPPKKVLALDADGTLWGGVIGEDGLAGIRVGDDPAARGYKQFQSQALALKKRGVLLVLVSKNAEADVWNALENHPGMLLRRKDFAAARINWNPKSQNLRELARELHLDVSSFVFLDDNPGERAEVEANCPEVTVVPLPAEPSAYAETLSRLWLFDGAGATREDAQRNEYMQQDVGRRQLRESAGDLNSYLKSLSLEVTMRRAGPDDLPRVSQLTERTSQFNLSLHRHSQSDLHSLPPDTQIWIITAKDRLGDYGTVGAGICRRDGDALVLDSLLTSCRALGCGVEDAFLYGLAQQARSAGARSLRAPFVAGPRNQPIKAFLDRTGFRSNGNGHFDLDLVVIPALPGHVRFSVS